MAAMRVALAQLDSRLGDVRANLERCRKVLDEAGTLGADLVVFPELFLSGYALHAAEASTTQSAEEVATALGGGPAVLAGFHEQGPDGGFNSAVFVEDGRAVHVHRKLYLVEYEPFCEHEVVRPGTTARAYDTRLGRLATLICNDAWQPFVPFIAAQDGARMLLVPSCSSTAVPEAERYWRELTRFHARMLQCWVVFVNRVGSEAGFTFWGGSHVVDPSGEVLAEAPRLAESILLADLELGRVEERRRELPVLGDPRLDLLRGELGRLSSRDASVR
jgi:predicted amidohydrolase